MNRTTPLCALVIGHKPASPGAVNPHAQLDEYRFNDKLSADIADAIGNSVDTVRVYRDTYRTLPDKINRLDPDFVVSLHCNAFNTVASGSEVLFYHQSQRGQHLAALLQARLVVALGLPDRGIKAKRSEDRGGYLLRYTDAPCVIAEPFFIDNDSDLKRALQRYDSLVEAYAGAIRAFAGLLQDG